MNKKARDRWVKALRSGDYAQGQGKLKQKTTSDTKYCCLGVLLEVEMPDLLQPTGPVGIYQYLIDGDRVGYNEGTLSLELRASLGLMQNQCGRLMNKNDEGESFLEIADWIEEHIYTDGEGETL